MNLLKIFVNPIYWMAILRMATPLYFAALGGVLVQRTGVLNIGLEGIILIGAFSGTTAAVFSSNIYLGILSASVIGLGLGLLLGLATVKMKGDQIIIGIIFNILAMGICSYFRGIIFGQTAGLNSTMTPTLPSYDLHLIGKIPIVGWMLTGQNALTYLLIVLGALSAILLYKTRFGLHLRIVGENARVADMIGISVYRYRTAMMGLSGVFAALGGAFLTLGHVGFYTDNISAGRGYIALAAVLLGRWHPLGALMACLLFGAAEALQYRIQTLSITIAPQFPLMLPYIFTLLSMFFLFRRESGPAEEGKPYIKEKT